MKRLLLLPCIFLSAFQIVIAQNDAGIQISWINIPSEVKDEIVTLKWGIKSSSQITDVSITLNGNIVKGINAVANDGYDLKKSQVLKLSKGDNVIEISVTSVKGNKKSQKTIIFKSDDGNNNNGNFGDYECIDSMIVAAYDGDPKAQYLMAKCYLDGNNGLSKDLFESSLWFKKSAERLYAPSQYEYSISLFEGRGILKNQSLAIHWLTESANKDFDKAQLKLGICYEEGEGVEKNLEKAKQLYHKCPLPEAKQRLSALEKFKK